MLPSGQGGRSPASCLVTRNVRRDWCPARDSGPGMTPARRSMPAVCRPKRGQAAVATPLARVPCAAAVELLSGSTHVPRLSSARGEDWNIPPPSPPLASSVDLGKTNTEEEADNKSLCGPDTSSRHPSPSQSAMLACAHAMKIEWACRGRRGWGAGRPAETRGGGRVPERAKK